MRTIHFASELFNRRKIFESALFIRINFIYFFFIFFRRSMDENGEIIIIRSRISFSSSRIILELDLDSGFIAVIIRSAQNAKFILLLIFQFCKFFIRVNPRYYARYIIGSSRLTYRLKIRSNLY
jgi:hypothetical protein